MATILQKIEALGASLQSVALLALRLTLAYGFYEPALSKWKNIDHVAQWFASMGYPLPTVSTYLVATVEAAGVILLALGLWTRLISIPLMIVMVVAITTVHWSNGFDASANGFEIPLYYLVMLLTLFAFGSGKWSLDRILRGGAS